MGVNTAHHQAVREVGQCKVNAVAEDGLIEGIELPGHKFCLGVQWHPEYIVTEGDFKIIEAFVKACRG
jgi:putative glutamine amidotransferase